MRKDDDLVTVIPLKIKRGVLRDVVTISLLIIGFCLLMAIIGMCQVTHCRSNGIKWRECLAGKVP